MNKKGADRKLTIKNDAGAVPGIERIVVIASITMFGLFYEAFSGGIGCVLIILALIRAKQNGNLRIPKSPFVLALGALPLMALITSLWAVDSGMALFGVAKYLPLMGMALLCSQESNETRERMLQTVPMTIAVVTLLTGFSYFTPLKDVFFINDRFSGTYQYANGFALILILSVITGLFRLSDKGAGKADIVALIINGAGIAFTGSRAGFAVTLMVLLLWFLSAGKEKRGLRNTVILSVTGLILVAGTIGIATGNKDYFGRFLDLDLKSSSFMGRLLYDLDGLKIMIKKPLGLGHNGYVFYKGSIQTGNYEVTFVHNELLQTAIDFGIAVGLLLLAAFLYEICRHGASNRSRIALIAVGLHSLVDWSLQFPATLMVLMLLIDCDEVIEVDPGKVAKAATSGILCAVMAFTLWLSAADLLEFLHREEAAASIYPGFTTCQMTMLGTTEDSQVRRELAEKITRRNEHCVIALQAMAEASAKEGDFDKMAEYGRKAVKAARYNTEGYEIYLYMLSFATDSANGIEDNEHVYKYLKAVCETGDIISEVKETTSPLAQYLKKSSEIKLDDEYEEYIEQARQLVG